VKKSLQAGLKIHWGVFQAKRSNLEHTLRGKRRRMSSPSSGLDEIDQGAFWADKEWVLTMTDLLGGCAAPLARWIH